jgi:hypothetical protein
MAHQSGNTHSGWMITGIQARDGPHHNTRHREYSLSGNAPRELQILGGGPSKRVSCMETPWRWHDGYLTEEQYAMARLAPGV